MAGGGGVGDGAARGYQTLLDFLNEKERERKGELEKALGNILDGDIIIWSVSFERVAEREMIRFTRDVQGSGLL